MSKQLVTRIIACTAAACIIVFGLMWAGAAMRLDAFMTGSAEGFELHGTYGNGVPGSDPLDITRASFEAQEDDASTGIWYFEFIADGRHSHASGTYAVTFDPNVYALYDDAGSEVGTVHLAYANAKGEGLAYILYEGHGTELEKKATHIVQQID